MEGQGDPPLATTTSNWTMCRSLSALMTRACASAYSPAVCASGNVLGAAKVSPGASRCATDDAPLLSVGE